MVDVFISLLWDSWLSILEALRSLLPIAVFFFLLGLMVKGRSVLADMRNASAQTGLNAKLVLINTVFLGLISAPCAELMVRVFVSNGWSLVDRNVWDGVPASLTIVFAVVLGDFTGYWLHRLEHKPFLWPTHSIHHSDTEVTWLTSERHHPLGEFLAFVIVNSALLLAGLPAEAIIANGLVRKNYGFLLHADLPWTYGPLARVFVSPAMHRWHHSADRSAYDKNYAIVFSVFDHLFGTLHVPGKCTTALGVTDQIRPGVAGLLAHPFLPVAYRATRSPDDFPVKQDRQRVHGKTAPVPVPSLEQEDGPKVVSAR